MLFMVSAVCAANCEVQAISAHNSTDTVVSTANDDNLKMNDANEILAETDDGSFAALNTKISGATAGSTVYLENDYEYSSTDSGTGGISINKNLIIDGKGHTIDAKQKSRIFTIDVSGTVDLTLKNIIFKNGKAGFGGAIYWAPDDGDGDIINCTFIDNRATGTYYSGAIYEYTGINNIINSTFINNYDSNGGLYLSATKVINSVFLNNGGTTLYGPNIEADYNWFGNTIDNYNTTPSVRTSSALNNWYVLNMTTNGANNVATLTLNNLYNRSEIKPCDTYALPSVTFDVEGTNATLNKDTVTLDSKGKASFGFTVIEDTGKLTASTEGVSLSKDVINMADEGNLAALNTKITDAISNGESEVKLYNDYVYNDSELVKNTINNGNSNNGIGIATDFTIDGQGYTIDGNNRGGRIFYIFAQSKLVTLKNINFVNCTDGYGGVFYAAYCDLRVINCTFTNSTVTANPGGVSYVSYPVTVEIINSTFIKNKAPSGGAIFVFGAQTTNVLVNNSIFINNIATNNVGSAVYCNKYGSYTINNCILLNNTGYAVYNNNAQSTLNVDYNWWGNTIENSDDWEVVSSYDENAYDNWVYLDVIIDDINSLATIKLNNLYTYGVGPSAYDYDLPKITLNVQTTNANINTNTVTLDENGQATINYEMTENEGTLKVSYVNVEITKDIKLFVQDSFTSLKRQIDECEESTFYLHQNYTYDSDFDENLTNGIEITKSITIDGNGYAIDGKGLKNIFYFDDNTNAKDLILKNIIFVNATATTNGAAVYFKGNKIEIINCTFINNKANSQGDAVYVADASSSDNKITESRFTNNSGENSVVYINLESANVKLNLSNSIFLNNDAAYDVKGTEDVIANYNWWGTTTEDYTTNSPKVDGATLNNWYVLNVTANTNTNVATVSLNNLYDGNTLTVYENYALPAIKFNVKGTGVIPDVDTITLSDGSSNFGFTLDVADSSLTLGYADIWQTTTEIHYVIVDDGSFKALYDLIRLTPENGVLDLTKNYTYSETDTITLGIPITKTITINGNDYTINADGKSRIFLINSDNIAFNDIIFINGVSENGGAIYSTVDYNYLNIDNCTFINNTATNTDGGAIWSGSYYFGSVTNSKFINNTAVEDGGAIFSYSYYTYATIDGCTFINNTGSLSSVMYAWVCKIQNSVFLNNSGNMIRGKYDSDKQINYNWFGNTVENYNTQPSMTSPITGWLYLNMKFLEDVAIVSLNNLYTSSSSSTSVYSNYNLPEITLNINSTTLNLNTDRITLDSTGKVIVPYTKIEDDAKLTVSNDYVSLTKDCLVGEFDVLQELIDTAVGDTVELNRNYTFIEGVDSLTNGISITRDITIDGKGHTIDGSNLARIFSITTNGVTLKNINFVNGYASHGGAIYNNVGSGFKLINCTFENNVAYNNPGAAVYTYSNGVNDFINCTFIGNKITASSQKNGGAIYVYEYSGKNNFIGCTFINNTATGYGGAIATANGNAITNIDKSVFVTNSAASYPSIYIIGGPSAEFYLNNSIIFSKGLTTDTSTQVRVNSNLRAGDVNNNWWMHTIDNYKQNSYVRFYGGGLSVTKYLFLDMNCENEIATLSINNLYDTSTQTYSTYDGELPQITFELSGVDVRIDDNVTLNKNGVGEAAFDITAQTGSITATCNSVSLTKSVVLDDSFTALQQKINRAPEGSELVLYHDYNFDDTKDTGLIDGIVLDKDLTINGQGFTLDAKDASRIFKINDNTINIVFKNIKFTNARADDGAAVYANCNNIEVINCTFEANEATNNGVALYVIANGCDITESTFINNLGTPSALYLASDLEDAPFNIDNSILVNNVGTDILKDDKIALTANNNWWGNTVDSTADLSGGIAQNWYILDMAVDNTQSIATVSLNNLWDGSAYSPCETYALPTITANIQTNGYASARKDKVIVDKDGDTVGYIVTDETNAGEITVSYNGISITREISYDEDSDYSFKALKKLIDAAQDNDTIELQHDYEYVIGYDDITSGIGIIQKNLTINGNGFTIDAKGQTRIFNVGISDNTTQGSNLTIKNTTFVNGKMSADGGAISWYGDDGNLANCTFVNNTVTGYKSGGAVDIHSKNMVVFNVTFNENKADNKGGAIYIYSDNVTISQSTFVKSDGGGNGGAIYWGKCDKGTIIDSTFIDNHANNQGGALETDSNAGDITVINSTFTNNKVTSTGKGGAIYWGNTNNRNIINSTFRDNYASSAGGALYWYTMYEGYNGIMYNSTFINNTATDGGAIYLYSGRLDIDKSDFIKNNATGSSAHGGAIYSMAESLSINNTKFTSNFVINTAGGYNYAYGGALYVSSTYGKLNIDNSNFIKNSAYSKSSTSGGGVMYVATNCNITNSTFIENSATAGSSKSTYGGVFYWYGAKGNISKSVFIDNYAKNYGTATDYGGVIYGSQQSSSSPSQMNVTNSIFINNKKSTYNTLNVMNNPSLGFYNFTECWFGNTRHDGYSSNGLDTKTGIIVSNRPLCLELDSYNEIMIVDNDKEIKYHLKYSEDDDTLVYDSLKLPKINLTLSTVKADVDKNSALVNETILFNANQYGSVSITAKFYGIEYTEDLQAKNQVIITVEEPIIVHVGDSVLVEVSTIPSVPTENIHYTCPDGTFSDNYIDVTANGYIYGKIAGTSTVVITFNGNETHAPATLQVPVTVIKYNTELVTLIDSNPIDSIAVDWGTEPQSIQIGILSDDSNPDYTGLSLNFKSNNTEVAKVTTNPRLITFGSAGTANITFSTAGNERYYGSEKNITVTVRKVASSIDLSKTDLEFGYGGSDSTTLTLVGCSVDDVNITVEGHPEAVIVFENNVITVSGLDVGTYTLKVTSTPDENHTSVTKTAGITVTKVDSSVEFENNVEFDYLGIGTTKLINFVGCSVDLVNITVEGQTGATVDYDDVTKVITVSNLNAGTYILKVSTTPDSNHNSVDVTADITVNKIDSSVTFGDIEFDYLGFGTTTISDYDGCTVDLANIVVVGHPEAVIEFENNVITVSGLGAGTHTLNVTTTPNANYKSKSVLGNIKVNPIASQITLNNTNIVYKYDESNTTKLTLDGCSVDLVNITVDGNNVEGVTYDVETQVITISGLKVGTYELKVVTTPDENHTSVYATASITVEKSNSSVRFSNPVSLFYSEEGTTTLTLNGCTVDIINVVDHPEAIIDYDETTYVVTVSGLAVGEYTLKVVTNPDPNHLSVENTTSVSVGKESPKLVMEYSNVTVGENELVFVSMGIAGDVNVTIFKGDEVIDTANVTIGDAGFNKTTFTGLKVGTYIITAYYKGVGRYNDSTLKYKLVIRPIYDYEASAVANDTVYGNTTNVTVTLPEDATGWIVIGDIEQLIDSTKTVVELQPQTQLGINNVTVRYVPDENSKYAARNFTVLYDVDKVDTEIALTVESSTTDEKVTITAGIKAEGSVIFDINGTKYPREIIGGQAILELENVVGGKYNVTAIYEGSEKYKNSTASQLFTVEKIDSAISIAVNPETINADETATVTVNVDGSGIVTFNVNGVETNVTVNDGGVATLTLDNLAKGTTTIKAKYLGDGKYNPSKETDEKTLTVNPISVSKLEIDVANITVGENATVYIFLPADATGKINITVSDGAVVKSENITSSKYVIPVKLGVGTYNVTVKYYGNDKYDLKVNSTLFSVKPLNVGKLDFVVKVNDTVIGNTTNVTVTLPADAKGIIKIGDVNKTIEDGTVTIELPEQTKAGLNNVTVMYIAGEGSKYSNENVTAFYNVAKKVANITIADITNAKAGSNVNVNVNTAYEADLVVYVDGVKQTVTKGKVTIENITAGKHTVVAGVAENGEHLANSTNYTFEVTKNDCGLLSVVCVEANQGDVFVGEKFTIQVYPDKYDDDVTGILVVNVNGTKYSLNLSETNNLKVALNSTGTVNLSAEYLGNYKYNSAKIEGKDFKIKDKTTPSIDIEVNQEYNVGDEVNVKVTTKGDNLTVIVLFDKDEIKKDTSGEFVFTPQKDGVYTIVARTTENATHYGAEKITTFTVTKKAASIAVNGIKDAKVGEEITFTVTSEPGNAIVKINNKTIDPTNGKYKFIPQTSGDYTLTVETKEDETYAKGFEIKTFKATKSDISIRISADKEVKVGEKATINVVIDADGIVEIDVDGTKYSLNVSDSKSLEVVMNRIGDIQVSAKYLGNERYNACDADPATIKVSEKTTPTIDIEVDPASAVVGDNVNIKVTTNGDNLIVTVLFDGEIKKAATGSLVFTPEKDGAYTIVARTSENATHYAAEKAISFSVINKTKKAPSITVSEIKDARVGEELTFTVESNVAGAVVKINGEVIPPSRGPYRYTPQTGGLHVLTVETPEDGTYSKGLYTQTFDVAKKQSAIQISIQGDLVVDKNIRLIISSYDGAEIAVMMDGKEFNWQNTFKATAGEHLVVASVAENDQYLSNTTSYTFTVAKAKSSISVSGNQVILGQASTITVGLTNGATGMVIVNVGGTEYSINASKSKSLSVVLSKPGTYDISARYLGDEKYLPSESASNTLIVEDKEKTTIDVYTPKDVNAGDNVEIEVVSNNNAIEVYFDGVKQTLKDDKFTVRNIKAGSHEIRVEGPETSELKSNATVSVFNADKQASEVTITLPKTISIGKDIVIEFSSYDGADITAVIDGVKQTLTGGKATLKATAGAHTIVASVDETDKYLASGANKTFNVDKLNSQIAVSGVDIAEGETSKITITTNVNEGIVIVNVADKQVAVDLAKAKSVDIELDTAGTYDLTANYLGTDIYKPSVAAKSTIKVQSKPAAKVDITIPDIKAGESKPISISIPNATGDVHVIVDGVDNVVTLDKDGKASYPLDNISAGEHNVVVVYDDGVNDPAISSKSFNVSKQTAKAEITTPANVKEGENATVKVNIPGATGEVSVIVDGNEEKIALVNGAAEYQLNNVSGGEHSVVVIYPGDETHDSAYSASSFDVAKKPAVVKKASEFSDITIDDDLMISFILKDEDGNPIRDAVIKYNDGTEKTVKTDYHGQFRIQAVNNALISITYEGNAAITGTGTAFKLNVPAAPVSQKVETHFDIPDRSLTLTGYAVDFAAGEEGIYYSTTLLDANGKPVSNAYMEFAVNNKIYNRTTDAKGSFTPYKLNMIRAGRYTMAFNFAGNENYTNTFACVCVDLDKKPITIKAASKTFKASVKTKKYTVSLSTIVGSSHDGKIYLKSGKPVTLTVNGKKYTAQTNSKNKATFKITGLSKKGTYDATIYFKGDKTYGEKEKTVKLTIS